MTLPQFGPASSYVKGEINRKLNNSLSDQILTEVLEQSQPLQPQIETSEGNPHPFNPFLFIIWN